MVAIADACANGELDARVVVVVSNRPDAAGVEAARQRGLKTIVIDHKEYDSRQSFDNELHEVLDDARPDWIVLAGFMRILTPEFVNQWHGRIINIHPSLLPLYPGLDTHARAIAAGDEVAGASVHLVTAELDAGPIVAQVQVPVMPDDDAESLAKRVLAEEHTLYVSALQRCVNGEISASST